MKSICELFLLAFLFTVSSCNNQTEKANLVINAFYNNYKPGDYRVVDKTLLSKELRDKIDRAAAKQADEAKKLKASGSTDKPLMIEGDIYTSLMEGATSHEIIRTGVNNESVKAEVKFLNNNYHLNWTDTIVLIEEDGALKIDNILYNPKQGGAKSTREVLDVFLNMD